jgi:methionine-rich copper-binding protein CopC
VVAALISGTFVVAGSLLWWMRSWTPTRDRWSDPAESLWPTALAGSLVLIAGLTVAASPGLPGLWRQILAQLSAIEFWEGLTTPSQFGGIVILPILLALFVPALVTTAAVFSLVFPFVLFARLRPRPLMFPTLFSTGAVCQCALVAIGWLATRLLREISQVAASTMSKAPDEDVRRLAEQLLAAAGTLTTTATMLVLPLAALVGWAVFLRPSGYAAAQFGRESAPGTTELPNLEGNLKEEPFVDFSAEAAEPVRHARAWRGEYGTWALIGLGVLMLLFAAMASARPRQGYVTSTPVAGASLATTPPAIRVTFSGALQSASTLSLVYVPVAPSVDDISRDVRVTSRLASSDAEQRTLEVIPPRLDKGLYLVRWVAHPRGGGVTRHGSFGFGVGVPVPTDSNGVT